MPKRKREFECVNNPNNFCYVCGNFVPQPNRRSFTDSLQQNYLQYFGIAPATFHEQWTPNNVCLSCHITPAAWASGSSQLLICVLTIVYAEVEVITKPRTGQEYVYVHAGSRALKKDQNNKKYQKFETSHKRPVSLSSPVNENDEKILTKRSAGPGEGPAPAPAGAIKLDPKKLLERYKSELKTTAPSTTTPKSSSPTKRRKRIKKEASPAGPTSPVPILTTPASLPKRIIDDDTLIEASGSDKKHSRIKIKEGPNGEEYEYEYVYYYYDDEPDAKDTKEVKASNSHDGPSRNEISRNKLSEKAKPVPEVNEIVPSTRGRNRERQAVAEDTVDEERLPVNTRFPPRSRNLNTTPLPEEEVKPTRGRSRGRTETTTTTEAPAEEPQVSSRGRPRSNIRRPSLELVDSASFNTHPSSGEPPIGGPSFPVDLPAGPVRFLGATPNEREDVEAKDTAPEEKKEEIAPKAVENEEKSEATESSDAETTTIMSVMKKAVLDLYALSQGTQKMLGEEDLNEGGTVTTEESEITTQELTTEEITTEITTPTTTTTTTTTTTPAPTTTTTTTTAAPQLGGFGRNRFTGRNNKKTTSSTATTSESPAVESRPKKFGGRPSFGKPRPGARTTAAPDIEKDVTKEESKPVSQSKPPSIGGGRRFSSRTRGRTTAAPAAEESAETSPSTAAPSRPSVRKPTLNLRGSRRTTTAAPVEESDDAQQEESSAAAQSTTPRVRPRITGAAVRPLRPGPRIGSLGRLRPGAATTTTTTEAVVEDAQPSDAEEEKPEEETADKEPEPAPTQDTNPLHRLRNRQRINVSARPKAAASAPVQVRRVNPLLARRKTTPPPEPSSEAPEEEEAPSTDTTSEDKEETEAPAPSSTTEEPKGLNRLLRRRIGARPLPTHSK